jgi:hypothetical protein
MMSSRLRSAIAASALFLVFGTISTADAQTSASTRFARGQSIQPVYEGWEQNADGTYNMWFGYLNRNWEERLTVPVGPDNHIQPGGPDRGQPTIFETGGKRRLAFAFQVVLPADWPKDRDLVWTLTANGQTFTAIGSLWSVWLVNEDVIATNRGSQRIYDPRSTNKPPAITETAKGGTVAVGVPLTLTVGVADDGLPRRRAAGELAPGGAGRGAVVAGRGRQGVDESDVRQAGDLRSQSVCRRHERVHSPAGHHGDRDRQRNPFCAAVDQFALGWAPAPLKNRKVQRGWAVFQAQWLSPFSQSSRYSPSWP